MNLKILSLFAAVLLVTACAQNKADTGAAGGAGQQVQTGGGSQGFRDQMAAAGDRIYFAFDRSDITAESRQVLLRQAALLNQNPSVTVTIEGHCDERGTVEYNLGLGERRANATKQARTRSGAGRSEVAQITTDRFIPSGPSS